MSVKQGEQLQIQVSGPDRPGILAGVMACVTRHRWTVRDIKQFVFNGMLNLSLLMESAQPGGGEPLKEAIYAYGRDAGLKISIYEIDTRALAGDPYKFRSVVTVLSRAIDTSAFLEITQTFAALDINILRIEQLDYGDYHVLEFVIGQKNSVPVAHMLKELVRFKESQRVDIAVQEDTLFRRNKRLIVLDADMTFLQCEIIDELGKLAGVAERMCAITHKAMSGEMDFRAALRERVGLLKGLPLSKLRELAERIPLTPGAAVLVRILKHLGFKIAIVSGGFQFFINNLKDKYGLDYGYANHLQTDGDVLTGELEGEIIDAKAKENILIGLAEKEGLSLKQVVAVGDGANDIYMLARAGLGIAFNAKPIVQEHAQASINISNLELILYFLGMTGKELQELRQIIDAAQYALSE